MNLKSRLRQIWIILLLMLPILLLVTPVNAENALKTAVQTSPTATVNTGALNVRSGPGIGYNIVAVANQGSTVTLLGRNADSTWAKIQLSDGRQGWVNAALLSSSVAISSLTVITDVADLTAVATIATGALNVRSGPDVTYSVLTAVSYGQTVALVGRNSSSSWAKVRLSSGQEGWVNTSLITPNVAISSLPIANAPAAPEPAVPVAPNALLSLRAGPSLSDTVIGHVYQGQRVQAIGRNDSSNWVKVRNIVTGMEGWIGVEFVQADVIIGNLPIMTGSSTPPAASTPVPVTTPTPTNSGTAVVTTSALNLRSGPGIGYGIVTVVYQGHTVTLLGRNSISSWVKVRTSAAQEGWMSAQYLTSTTAINSLPILDAATLTAVGTVNTGALNVRSGPGIEYSATAVVFQGTSIGLIGRNSISSWVKVRLSNNHIGWVNAAFIDTVTTINSLPITN